MEESLCTTELEVVTKCDDFWVVLRKPYWKSSQNVTTSGNQVAKLQSRKVGCAASRDVSQLSRNVSQLSKTSADFSLNEAAPRPGRSMMISVMPRASATGVSRWRSPGNLQLDIFDPTAGNRPTSLESMCEQLFGDVPAITLITSRTLTRGGVSEVLRICTREASVISLKTPAMAARILPRE